MSNFPKRLVDKLKAREEGNAFRELGVRKPLVDFSSNDYLGLATNTDIYSRAHQILEEVGLMANGATGSRLLSGNHVLYPQAERVLAQFYGAEEALLFNSGYDANLGFFATVPQRGDVVLFDALIHASIRDGIQLGHAKAYKFAHNNLKDLEVQIAKAKESLGEDGELYVVTESVFSMDGDTPDLDAMATLCYENGGRLLVDEAHAVGIYGPNGGGLVSALGLQDKVFARIVTFGKAMGCHGAAIVGNAILKTYLVNFCRSLIYTTALPPHAVATVLAAHEHCSGGKRDRVVGALQKNIGHFKREASQHIKELYVLPSDSAIQVVIVPGNTEVKQCSQKLRDQGFDVRPILSPTVPEGEERLRFCLHAYNTAQEISTAIRLLSGNV